MKNKLSVIIGRFRPFHNGHEELVKAALDHSEMVLILVGSSNSPKSIKNPFTFDEVKEMIEETFWDEAHLDNRNGNRRVVIRALNDVYNNDSLWVSNVRSIVNEYASDDEGISIVGHEKDASSYYLNIFQGWDVFNIPIVGNLSATNIRDAYFQDAPIIPFGLVPKGTIDFLSEYWKTENFKYILDEYKWKRDYDQSWAAAPFPPQFVTVDNVVTHSGKILLVTRGGQPGYGLLALPGGFVEAAAGDSFENAVKELWEETEMSDDKGRIPKGRMKSFYTDRIGMRFDNPERSSRGYTLTTAFRMDLPANKTYTVKGGDDAMFADWYNIADLKESDLFEDHYHIIQEMI